MNEYDVIIIGAGISGLYSAYQIKKMSPRTSVLLLEENDTIGGRMNKFNFFNTEVNTGAGIGRKKDTTLVSLLDDLNIKYQEFKVQIQYADKINKDINLQKITKLLKRKYTKKEHYSYTFKRFAVSILGSKIYRDYVTKLGYSDFEKEDANEVLTKYSLEENEGGWVGLSIDWALLLSKLAERIGLANIKVNKHVDSITRYDEETFVVNTSKTKYVANKIIIATNIETVAKLLPNFRIYDQIHGQVFLRVYAKLSHSIPNLDCTTIVTGPLKKISPINSKENIYMIAYTDNDAAISLKNYINNNAPNRQHFCNLVEKALDLKERVNIVAIKSFYWEIGTHYYSPLSPTRYKNRAAFIKEAQHPTANIFVVGEMISENQGWSNGALESVHKVLGL